LPLESITWRPGRYPAQILTCGTTINTYPESYLGYKLKADLLIHLEMCPEAKKFYKKAIDRSDGTMRELIKIETPDACGIVPVELIDWPDTF
jgi:hypothetical protein